MEDQEAGSRRDAVTSAASDAYWQAQASVLRIAKASGAEIRERPSWPGSVSTTRYAEPLAGLRAAQTVQHAAGRVADDYMKDARAEGIGWREIGEALGLANDGERTGYDLAVAAYEHVTGEPDRSGSAASTTPARHASRGSATAARMRATRRTTSTATAMAAPGWPPPSRPGKRSGTPRTPNGRPAQ